MTAACLDPRLVTACLAEAGAAPHDCNAIHALLAAMLCGEHDLVATREIQVSAAPKKVVLTIHMQWDCVRLSSDLAPDDFFNATLARFAHVGAEPLASQALNETVRALKSFDEKLAALGTVHSELKSKRAPLTLPVCEFLISAWRESADRTFHTEIAQLFCGKIASNDVRQRAGEFVVRVLAVPAARTHRFILCDALENLAAPELAPSLAAVIQQHRNDSLRGRWCTALAKCGRAEDAKLLADVVRNSSEETLVRALTALGDLRAKAYVALVTEFCDYQCADKEWTLAVRKAAQKARKRI